MHQQAIQVAASPTTSLVLTNDGEVITYGEGPKCTFPPGSKIVRIAVGSDHFAAVSGTQQNYLLPQ